MNKKGFTFIEFLTLIVILAIASLVTAPAILKVIHSAREEAASEKAWKTIEAVKSSYLSAKTLGYKEQTPSTGIAFENNILIINFSETPSFGDIKVDFNGSKPISGTVSIDTTLKRYTCNNLEFTTNGNYKCSTNEDGTKMNCTKK